MSPAPPPASPPDPRPSPAEPPASPPHARPSPPHARPSPPHARPSPPHARPSPPHARPSPSPETFEEAVERVIRALRPGDVVTYGEVAVEAGRPGAARAVGHLLSKVDGSKDDGLPWWRVVHADGRLVPGNEAEQARRLRTDGVDVRDHRVRRPAAARPQPRSRHPG